MLLKPKCGISFDKLLLLCSVFTNEMWILLTVVRRWSKKATTWTTRGHTSPTMDSATTDQMEDTSWGPSLTTGLVLRSKKLTIVQAPWAQPLVSPSPCPETLPQTSLWSCPQAMKRKLGATTMGEISKTWAGGAVEGPTTIITTWADHWPKPWDLLPRLPQPVFSISWVSRHKPFIDQCKTNTTTLFLLFVLGFYSNFLYKEGRVLLSSSLSFLRFPLYL